MKRFLPAFLILLMITGFSQLNAQQKQLSELSQVSLLTCDPGEELYSSFGHTAIRIMDPSNGIDWVYHYGIFDFNTSFFYWKFIRGKTDYLMGINQTSDFLQEYKSRESKVTEQILNLTLQEKNILFNNLMINNLPENREYRYNFVFDNCATRPRDQLIASSGNKMIFDTGRTDQTFRQLIGQYLKDDYWTYFGINLIFGMEADRIATGYESQFLPLILRTELDKAQIMDSLGVAGRKLVKSSGELIEGKSIDKSNHSWLAHPFFYAILFLLAAIYMTMVKKKKSETSKLFDTIWLVPSGLAGLLITFLMIFSDHPLVGNNINLLWLNPLNLVVAYYMWKHKFRKPLFVYYILNVLMVVTFIILVALQKQSIPFEVIPLSGLILLRFARRAVRSGKRIIVKTANGYKWR